MKYISLLLCLALLVVAIVYTPPLASNDVVAGAGSGENEVIHAPSDMCELLQFICDNDNSLDASSLPSAISLSTNGQKSSDAEYESVTIHEVGYTSVVSEDVALSMNREMDMYVSPTASYYHSVGVISQNGEASSMLLEFDVEVFIDYRDQKGYYKINRWTQYGEDSVQFSSEILGKWLYFTSGMGKEIFSSVDLSNRDGFKTIGDALERAERSGEFQRKNGKYTLSSDEVRDILGMNGRFELDLRDADEPALLVTTSDHYGTTSVYMDAAYRFSNVNNTVVRMDKNAKILELTDEEMEQYVLVSSN